MITTRFQRLYRELRKSFCRIRAEEVARVLDGYGADRLPEFFRKVEEARAA